MKQLAFATYRFKNQLFSRINPSRTAEKALHRFIRPRRFEPKAWEKNAESVGQRFSLNPQVSAIRWYPQTKAGAPKKLLLVHGWESRATQMFGLVPALLDIGFEVVAVDMPGHGHSDGEVSHAKAFVETVLLTQKKLGKFDAVIGHSMGAGASSIAISHGLETDKLILISGPSSVENVLRRFSGFVGLNHHATEKFLYHTERVVGVSPAELDAVNATQKIHIPTLIIHDKEDQEVPISESERLLSTFKNAEFFATEGLGHRKILKSQYVIEKVCSFLNG